MVLYVMQSVVFPHHDCILIETDQRDYGVPIILVQEHEYITRQMPHAEILSKLAL